MTSEMSSELDDASHPLHSEFVNSGTLVHVFTSPSFSIDGFLAAVVVILIIIVVSCLEHRMRQDRFNHFS